jgi:hypothetical protein
MAIHPALRANISETLPVVVINGQGEQGKNTDEQEFSHSRTQQLLDTRGVSARSCFKSPYCLDLAQQPVSKIVLSRITALPD